MKKRILAILLCFMLCSSNIASAELNWKQSEADEGTIVVSGTSNDEDILITVLKENVDLSGLYDDFSVNSMLYYRQIETSGGKFEHEIKMPSGSFKGNFLITAGSEVKLMPYASLSYKIDLVDDFTGAVNSGTIETILEADKDFLGLWEMYKNLDDMSTVAEVVKARLTETAFSGLTNDEASWGIVKALINEGILVAALNENETVTLEKFKEIMTVPEIQDFDLVESYVDPADSLTKYRFVGESNMTAEGLELVMKNLKGQGFTTYSEFKLKMMKQLILQAFNNPEIIDSYWLANLLESNSTLLGVDLTSYNTLSDEDKASCATMLSAKKCTLANIDATLQALVASIATGEIIPDPPTTSDLIIMGTDKNTAGNITDNTDVWQGTTGMPFNDIAGYEWAWDAISYFFQKNVVVGYGDGTLLPGSGVKRSEFATMVVKAMYGNLSTADTAVFTDVPTGHWAFPYVMTAYEKNLIAGMGEGTYMPDVEIKREDVAVVLAKAIGKDAGDVNSDAFADFDEIAEYAQGSVSLLKEYGIVAGSDGKFNPKASASRAEVLQMIYNTLKFLNPSIQTPDAEEGEKWNTKEQGFLVALGVIDDTFDYNFGGTVKKEIFADMVMTALSPNGIDPATGTVYADVPTSNESADAIEALAKMCGIQTTGEENFYPLNEIMLKEAVKMIIDATGYSYFVNAAGGGSYYTLASNYKLLKGVKSSWEEKISGNDAVMLVYNMLRLSPISTSDLDRYEIDNSISLLGFLHNISEYNGIVSANDLTAFYSSSSLDENTILMATGGGNVRLNCGTTDTADYIGYNVTAYCEYDEDLQEWVILYAEPNSTKNNTITLDFDEIVSLSDNEIVYKVEGTNKNREAAFVNGKAIIYNDTYYVGARLDKSSFTNLVGNVTLIDNDANGKYDILKVTAYETYVVNSLLINDKIVYDKFDSTRSVNLDEVNYAKYSFSYADGSEIEIEDMQDGVVLSVARNASGCSMSVIEVLASTDTVSGIVTDIENDNYMAVTLDDDDTYKVTTPEAKASIPTHGTGVYAHLDAFGNIAYIGNSIAGGSLFGLLVDIIDYQSEGKVATRIYSQENTMKVYDFAEKVEIDGNRYRDQAEIKTVLEAVGTFQIGGTSTNGTTLPQGVFPIRFTLNSKEEIVRIDTLVPNTGSEAELTEMTGKGKWLYTSDGMLGYKIPTRPSTMVLRLSLPSSYTKEDLSNIEYMGFSTASARFTKERTYMVTPLSVVTPGVTPSPYPDLVIQYRNYSSTDHGDSMLVIRSVGKKYNEEENTSYTSLKGYTGGKEVEFEISREFETEFLSGDYVAGDVVRYLLDKDGRIVDFQSDSIVKYNTARDTVSVYNYDGSNGNLAFSSLQTQNANVHIMHAYVLDRQEGLVKLGVFATQATTGVQVTPRNSGSEMKSYSEAYVNIGSSVPVTVFDTSKTDAECVYMGTYDDIKDVAHNGNDYSRIVLRYRSSELMEVIVLNDSTPR